jgi:hypothetical protein
VILLTYVIILCETPAQCRIVRGVWFLAVSLLSSCLSPQISTDILIIVETLPFVKTFFLCSYLHIICTCKRLFCLLFSRKWKGFHVQLLWHIHLEVERAVNIRGTWHGCPKPRYRWDTCAEAAFYRRRDRWMLPVEPSWVRAFSDPANAAFHPHPWSASQPVARIRKPVGGYLRIKAAPASLPGPPDVNLNSR